MAWSCGDASRQQENRPSGRGRGQAAGWADGSPAECMPRKPTWNRLHSLDLAQGCSEQHNRAQG
eukprot:9281358-Alexandrium_andersonii.AAC.1